MLKQRKLLLALAVLVASCLAAQNQDVFKTRLYPVPIDATMRADVTGAGSASAQLSGKKLTINGSFEGLHGPATAAKIYQGPVTGVRGTALFDLTVSKATSGTIGGSVELTPEQIESLRKGRLYIQLSSEKAPDGNLWGWLLR